MNINIRRVYLYLTSLIGLILMLIGSVQLINLGLKAWVFTKADDNYYGPCYEKYPMPMDRSAVPATTTAELSKADCDKERDEQRTARRQSDAARSIAFIIVGAPVWLYHWGKVKDERDA